MQPCFFQRVESGVERLDRRLDQHRSLRGAPLQPADDAGEFRHRRFRSGDGIVSFAQILGDLFRLHHDGAARGERGLFARFGLELVEFVDGVAQPVAFAFGPLDLGAVAVGFFLRGAARLPQAGDFRGVAFERTEGVEQAAMRGGVDQCAVVMLAVNLDQHRAQLLHHLHGDRLVVDEGAGAPVGELDAAQDQLILGRNIVGGQNGAGRMLLRHLEHGDDLALLQPLAHQSLVAAAAERQREGVQQDRFAGAGLAGQHGKVPGEIDVEPVDQDDIADGETSEHSDLVSKIRHARHSRRRGIPGRDKSIRCRPREGGDL